MPVDIERGEITRLRLAATVLGDEFWIHVVPEMNGDKRKLVFGNQYDGYNFSVWTYDARQFAEALLEMVNAAETP